jgi:peptidoglycan/xylan/chitin deacetylase (PgdA/CDA1 family)
MIKPAVPYIHLEAGIFMFVSFRLKRTYLFALCAAAAIAAVVWTFGHTSKTAAVSAKNTQDSVRLPIIMYHSILKDPKYHGKYVVSPQTFESDICFLQKNGYETVGVSDVVDYVKYLKPLPAKPVMLTFDDGYYNNYLYAYPLAKKYNVKIVIAPVGYYTDVYAEKDADHPNYSYLTWGEMAEMMSSGLVEFENHSYNLHYSNKKGSRLGAKRLPGESRYLYDSMLKNDLGKMQERMKEKTGCVPLAFVYPFGAFSNESVHVLRQMGFQATFLCTEKINLITHSKDCLYSLGRFLRPSGPSSTSYFKKVGICAKP